MRRIPLRNCLLVGLFLFFAIAFRAAAAEQPDTREAEAFFESKIRPILVERCQGCHGSEKQKGNLRLDSLAAMVAGGDGGPALMAGKPEESLLIEVIGYASDLKMPPKSKLPQQEIALLTEWVKRGAVWPNAKPVTPAAPSATGPLFTPEQKAFWAFQPVVDAQPPVVQNEGWCQSPLDRFVLAGLEATGLSPAPQADRRTLIRRATFDLTGLPPTPEEIAAFLADDSHLAFSRVIDRLLASPRYGERWGRHWLDVARYADSNGLDENLAYGNAHRYRDYVIAAFNTGKPYDEFLTEQLAGDLLPTEEAGLAAERLTATGFLSLGAKMLAEDDPVKMRMDIIDEQVDTVGRTFLGLTLGCARCHDHKFDPVPHEDYYSLAGIFNSTKTMDNFTVVARWQERPVGSPTQIRALELARAQVADKAAEIGKVSSGAALVVQGEARKHVADYLLAVHDARELEAFLASAQPLGNMADIATHAEARLIEAEDFVRGNVLKDTTGYGKGIGVLVNKGELPNFTEYEVTLPEAGWYQTEIRLAAAGSRPCRLFLNGELAKANAAGRVTGSWTPESQTWGVEGIYRLKAGVNLVRLECAGPFPHIDKLLFVRSDYAPRERVADSSAPAEQFIQQWKAYLALPESSDLWRQWNTLGQPDQPPANEFQTTLRGLFQETPRTHEAVAARYQELIVAADSAWQALLAADPQAKSLVDPIQEALRTVLTDPKGPFAVPKDVEPLFPPATQTQLVSLRAEKTALEKAEPTLPEAMVVSDDKPQNLRVHLRGSHLTLGKETPRQFLRIVAGEQQQPIGANGSGRLELAQWLTHPDHPLSSRVMINRIWLWHFGDGLVRSPDNFGRLGDRPTHPALLDWLARRFVESGWSIKAMHRLIMLSSTYQMSSRFDEQAFAQDPDNHKLWHKPRRRLEAEAIRDSLLAVSGKLDLTMGGTQLTTENRRYVTSTANVNPEVYGGSRRSIYLPIVRSALFEVLQAFDFADPSVQNGRRDVTTVAPQALFMMNSKFVSTQSLVLAKSILNSPAVDDTARVMALYERSLGRPASPADVSRALGYVERMSALPELASTSFPPRVRAWQSLCRAVLASNEFVYVE